MQKTVFGGQPTKPDYEFVASAVFWYVDHHFMMKCLNCVILLYPGLEGLTGFFICYSQPPLSVVGLTEQKAVVQAKNDILVYTSSFNAMKNTISG